MNTSIPQHKVFCKITLTNKQKFISFSQNQCRNQFEHWLCLKGLIGNLRKLHHVNVCALIEQFHQLGRDCCPFIYFLSPQHFFNRSDGFCQGEGRHFVFILCTFVRNWFYELGHQRSVETRELQPLLRLA